MPPKKDPLEQLEVRLLAKSEKVFRMMLEDLGTEVKPKDKSPYIKPFRSQELLDIILNFTLDPTYSHKDLDPVKKSMEKCQSELVAIALDLSKEEIELIKAHRAQKKASTKTRTSTTKKSTT